MHLRLRARAARSRIIAGALMLGTACVLPAATVLAQTNSPPDDASSAPAKTGAVFDAPGMPGVRMMAPIPDKADPVPAPAAKKTAKAPAPKKKDAAAKAVADSSSADAKPVPDVIPQPKPSRAADSAAAKPAASSSNRAQIAQAFSAMSRNWNRARMLAAEAGNQAARLIVEWRYVLDDMSGANFETISAFLNEHPGWPRHDALTVRAERTMPEDMAPRDVIQWYSAHPPVSGNGYIRLGTALMETGKRDQGAALIRKGWTDFTFSQSDEKEIGTVYANVIGAAEQKMRLLKLLAKEDLGGAQRQMQRVGADVQRLGNALLRIKASPALAKTVLASFPESSRDPELLFEAARALRRQNHDQDAWDLMAKAPTDKDDMAVAERWSAERQIMARDALKIGQTTLAYQFASTPALAPDAGTTFMDAEFLAGWIALRYLHKPDLAQIHFQRLANGVNFPISVARAHYWLGRTDEALNKPMDALAEYRRAANYSTVFYGQLALAKLNETPVLHMNVAVSDPLPSERAAFEGDERVQAMKLLTDMGDRSTARQFALAIATDTTDPKRLSMLAETVAATGDQALSVRVAKNASYNEVYLQPYLHPVVAMPKVKGSAPEAALVLGLARQESEFDTGAVSTAGARGLMQLMPASAKHAATVSGIAFRPANLNNADYNMQLGMATIGEYLDRWDGSYVLAIASYNAGPRNVSNWVDAFGDPRDGHTDPIDWVESIPFPETRNYVERVLENVEVYRNRLNNSDQKLSILADLYRPNPMSLPAIRQAIAIPSAPVPDPNASVQGGSALVPASQVQ